MLGYLIYLLIDSGILTVDGDIKTLKIHTVCLIAVEHRDRGWTGVLCFEAVAFPGPPYSRRKLICLHSVPYQALTAVRMGLSLVRRMHGCNVSTLKAEAGGPQVQSQPGLARETLN